MKPLVVFIVGPTASGKTAAAVELARRLNGEIVSADSMQVYQGMDIGTAKPSAAERKKIPHHLIDTVPVSRRYSVFKFYTQALKALRSICKRKRVPVVAGGTGLYVRSLLQGLGDAPASSPSVRKKIEKLGVQKGGEWLHARLKEKNPERASQIDPRNLKRIVRALEIEELSKQVRKKKNPCLPLSALGFDVRIFGIRKKREVLYADIDRRVDAMFKKGLVREAMRLKKMRISPTAKQALGYKEIWDAAEKGMLTASAKEAVKQRTRQFAKRQITWFKKEPGIHWLDVEAGTDPRTICLEILKLLQIPADNP